MQITRNQIRKMILKEMAEIMPFPGMKPRADEFETMSGVYMALQSIKGALTQMKGAATVGRRGVGAPAGQLAQDVVGTTARMLDTYMADVRALADEDEEAFDILSLLEGLDRILATVDQDPSAVRAAAMQIGRMINLSSGILSDMEGRYGLDEEL